MKKLFLTGLCLLMTACNTMPNSDHSMATASSTTPKTSLFYYSVNPQNYAQAMSLVRGQFIWKNGCIYLVDSKGNYSTAMFPMYPKSDTHWDESTKTITLHGVPFKMGDSIITNGMYDTYVPNVGRFIEYEQQGDKKCLNSSLAYIGTVSVKRL